MSATGQKAKVLFAYAPLAANQISLKAGQIINITSYGGAGGWSSGEEIGTGLLLVTYCTCIVLRSLVLVDFREARLLPFRLR
jgi:hypothetical protein